MLFDLNSEDLELLSQKISDKKLEYSANDDFTCSCSSCCDYRSDGGS